MFTLNIHDGINWNTGCICVYREFVLGTKDFKSVLRPWTPADPSNPKWYQDDQNNFFSIPTWIKTGKWINLEPNCKLGSSLKVIPQNGDEEPHHRTGIMSCHLPWILSLGIKPALHIPESSPSNKRLLHHWLEIKLWVHPIPLPPFPAVSFLSIIRHRLSFIPISHPIFLHQNCRWSHVPGN